MVFKIRWLLLSLLGVLVFSWPAEAANLLRWRFDQGQNRLEFSTDSQIQPRAQLIFNPTRVVVDLPGTKLGRSQVREPVGRGIQSYRIGQFDAQTTRIVIELERGYTLDPTKVMVRGISATTWAIELPEAQLETAAASGGSGISSGVTGSVGTQPTALKPGTQLGTQPGTTVSGNPAVTAPTQIEEVRTTADGLFLRTSGKNPKVKVRRSRDRRTIDLEIRETALAAGAIAVPTAAPQLGVQQMTLSQKSTTPPVAQLSLKVTQDAPDWQATVSNFNGIVFLPKERPQPTEATGSPSGSAATTPPSPNVPPSNRVATLQSVSLDRGNNQLLVQVDQPVKYVTRWEGSEYVLSLSPAQLADTVQEPRLYVGDRLRQIKIQQQSAQNVEIRVTPDKGVNLGTLQVPTRNLLALPLQRQNTISVTPPTPLPTTPSNPFPPTGPTLTPPTGSVDIDLPRVNRRAVVVIDPGHGGPDPGAVGNGLRETDIVLDISRQITALLQQQGVQVIMTRNAEFDLDLQPRVDIAENANATLFVSIHANAISLSRPEVNGVESYYYSSGQSLAQTIHRSILESINMGDRGVRQARFYVLRRTSMPAVLIETGFITGAEDSRKLASPEFRTRMARAIARGILRYLQ